MGHAGSFVNSPICLLCGLAGVYVFFHAQINMYNSKYLYFLSKKKNDVRWIVTMIVLIYITYNESNIILGNRMSSIPEKVPNYNLKFWYFLVSDLILYLN